MLHKVLLAVGEKNYSDILKDCIMKHPNDFILSNQEVLHTRFLDEIVTDENPTILIVHDYYLESDVKDTAEREKEWIRAIRKFRVQYEDSLRIIFLCERSKGDPFLATLVSLGVMDIFNQNSFDLDDFIAQLKDKAKFARVEKFLIENNNPFIPEDTEIVAEGVEEDEPDVEIEKLSPTDSTKTPSENTLKSLLKKKVAQANTEKHIIKREYGIHVHNHVEKIVGIPIEKKTVLIGGLLPRSGSTFISHLLAKELAKLEVKVAYLENPYAAPYTFDRFDGRNENPHYISKYYSVVHEHLSSNEHSFNKENVEMIIKNPMKEGLYTPNQLSFEKFIRILLSINATMTIIDIGCDWDNEVYQDLFDIADVVYLVIEPDIANLQVAEYAQDAKNVFVRKMLEQPKVNVIGNRFDEKTFNYPMFQDLYGDKLIEIFPTVSVSDIFDSQYLGRFIQNSAQQKELETAARSVLFDILPSDLIINQQNKGFLGGLFKKKIKIDKVGT